MLPKHALSLKKFVLNCYSGNNWNSQKDKNSLKHLKIIDYQGSYQSSSTMCVVKINVHTTPKCKIERGKKDRCHGGDCC